MTQIEVIRSRHIEDFQASVNSTLEELQRTGYEIINVENKAVADVNFDFYVCFITYKNSQNP